MLKTFLSLLCLASLSACQTSAPAPLPTPTASPSASATPQPSPQPTPSPSASATTSVPVLLGTPFELMLQQSGLYAQDSVEIQFAQIVSDSRCPIDVVCVWAGQAEVAIRVQIADSAPQDVRLWLGKSESDTQVVVGGYRLTLQALTPFPDTQNPPTDAERRVKLLLEKVS
ncbi:MAG: hypothetical protein ACO1RX_08780 [Candidatus Sericytochromatia bacterium]